MNLACVSRYLEEPVLSTLWEGQPSLCTLLKVLPGDVWKFEKEEDGGIPVVRDLEPSLGESTLKFRFSSRLWGIHHQRLGTGSSATRLGCDDSAWKCG